MQASAVAAVSSASPSVPAHRWTVAEVIALYELPLMDLIWRAQGVHRENFDPNAIQRSTLLSVKTGGFRRLQLLLAVGPLRYRYRARTPDAAQ
jgi:biotin synthase